MTDLNRRPTTRDRPPAAPCPATRIRTSTGSVPAGLLLLRGTGVRRPRHTNRRLRSRSVRRRARAHVTELVALFYSEPRWHHPADHRVRPHQPPPAAGCSPTCFANCSVSGGPVSRRGRSLPARTCPDACGRSTRGAAFLRSKLSRSVLLLGGQRLARSALACRLPGDPSMRNEAHPRTSPAPAAARQVGDCRTAARPDGGFDIVFRRLGVRAARSQHPLLAWLRLHSSSPRGLALPSCAPNGPQTPIPFYGEPRARSPGDRLPGRSITHQVTRDRAWIRRVAGVLAWQFLHPYPAALPFRRPRNFSKRSRGRGANHRRSDALREIHTGLHRFGRRARSLVKLDTPSSRQARRDVRGPRRRRRSTPTTLSAPSTSAATARRGAFGPVGIVVVELRPDPHSVRLIDAYDFGQPGATATPTRLLETTPN